MIFRMIEAGKTHWGFSYSQASELDFGLYIQTGWDWILSYHASNYVCFVYMKGNYY